jgi:hypothetical protein
MENAALPEDPRAVSVAREEDPEEVRAEGPEEGREEDPEEGREEAQEVDQ